MKYCRYWMIIAIVALSLKTNTSYAGRVRTLYTNDRVMQPVFFAMGRSTVLRFDEKPKNAVIGNGNYFSLEFIGNDITIQPQGTTVTNLFVYTEYQTYGLILQGGNAAVYDDLVYVKYRPGYVNTSEKPPTAKAKTLVNDRAIQKQIEIKGILRATIYRAIQSIAQGLWILEIELENLSKENLATNDVQVIVGLTNKVTPYQKTVFEKEVLSPGEKTQGRTIIRTEQIDGVDICVKFHDREQTLLLPKRSK